MHAAERVGSTDAYRCLSDVAQVLVRECLSWSSCLIHLHIYLHVCRK